MRKVLIEKKSSNRSVCNWFRVRAYKKERGICFVMQKTPILWHLSTMENWIKVPKGIYFFFFKATSFKSCTMGGKRNFPWKYCIIGLKLDQSCFKATSFKLHNGRKNKFSVKILHYRTKICVKSDKNLKTKNFP